MHVHLDITDGSDREGRGDDVRESVTVAGTDGAADGGAAPGEEAGARASASSWAASADDTGQPVDAGPPPTDLLQALGTETPPTEAEAHAGAFDAGAAPEPDTA